MLELDPNLFIFLYIYIYIKNWSIYLFIYPFTYLFIYLFIYLSIHISLKFYMHVCLPHLDSGFGGSFPNLFSAMPKFSSFQTTTERKVAVQSTRWPKKKVIFRCVRISIADLLPLTSALMTSLHGSVLFGNNDRPNN